MNRLELVSAVSAKAGLTKTDAEKAVNAVVETVKEVLKKKEELTLIGFGTFSTVERKATEARNPQTGEKIAIPAKTAAKFKPSKKILD